MKGVVVNAWENPYGVKPVPVSGAAEPSTWQRLTAPLAPLAPIVRPVYKLWIRFGHVMGTIMTGLLLTILYLFVLGPLHVYLRLTGGLPIEMGFNKKIGSYWDLPRSANRRDRNQRQF